jgi:hypothetical protein
VDWNKWCHSSLWGVKRKHSQLSLKCSRVCIEMNYEKFKRSDRPDRFRSLTLLSTIFYPLLGKSFSMITSELRGYFTLKSLLHSGLKQVMSLFTLGSARAVLVVALVYSFPDVFNVLSITLKFILSLVSQGLGGVFKVILVQMCSWNCENTPMHILLSNETRIYLL